MIPSSTINLQHRPTGWGHPYEQELDERMPRRPEVGQPFVIGAVSHPTDAVQSVSCRWRFERGDWKVVEAEQLPSGNETDHDRWRVVLPAQSISGQMTYEVIGVTNDDESLSAGSFEVEIPHWVVPDRLVDVAVDSSTLDVSFGFDAQSLMIHCRYWLDKSENLFVEMADKAWDETPDEAQGQWHLMLDNKAIRTWENGCLQLQVDLSNRSVALWRNGAMLMTERQPFELLMTRDKRILAYRRFYHVEPEEIFVGLGERFNALDQRGSHLDTRVFEQYRRQGEKTYIPIPFFLSSRGWGYFQDTLRRADFDFPGDSTQALVITQESGPDLAGRTVIFTDPVWEANAHAFTRLVAEPVIPPIWAFGLWMSSNEWYFQDEVLHQVRLMKEHDVPATALVIEAWSDEENFYIWNDAQYDLKDPTERFKLSDFTFPEDGLWPDPKGMTDELHQAGLKLILWQIPVLKFLKQEDLERYGPNPQHDLDESYMIEQGYCVRNPDGSPYRVPPMIWFAEGLVWDVTNPEAVAWWLSRRQYLVEEIGVDGFKTDGGEHLWGEDLLFADGRTSAELINAFPRIYQQAYYDFANSYRSDGAVNFSRAGYTGSQTAPLHWAGDQVSTWDAFRAVLLAGQNLGLSGVPFWGWDIGGFSGPIPSAELYLRSTAAATFAPVMQYHSEHNQHKPVSVDRTPWNIQEQTGDERVLSIFRRYAHLRMNLLPYLYNEAVHTSQTGQPLFGCPLVRFEDRRFLDHPYQFLCGRHLLIAPITEPDVCEWPVYLPAGRWIDFWRGEIYEGGRVYILPVAIGNIPVFVSEGAILPFNLDLNLQFGAGMSNDLDHYDALTLTQFGDANPEFQYEWHDFLTGETFLIGTATDLKHDLISLKNKVRMFARKII